MEIVKVRPVIQMWLYKKDVEQLIGRKSTSAHNFLRDFEKFCRSRPNYFKPVKPFQSDSHSTTQYNYYAIVHFFENRELLMAGTRSINFKNDLERLKEAY
ncbi:hypothetical protein [Facklamia miroungae]|uniref:Uncharacterized protein n=1 Tax=Facklamia miroungae TaxID=120956 RepID=A0A1G7NY42_9LACT|nr:hypothetical protein [Facklamia miroungae]NKZ28512.1 hypothetical protein [Facklamia miroungae]SDF78952.1 hypothetical protein SAMN05421791_10153 [Facklamia miroungae]